MKKKRQAVILELIKNNDIETQEELARMLSQEGFTTTQGTISRDIRELKLTKISGADKKQKYAPLAVDNPQVSDKYKRVLSEGIVSMDYAQNILVIKTVSGMAMACAAALDSISIKGILGSIAGDDTIMCVVREADMVETVIGGINEIIS